MILILRPPHRATRSSLRAALTWARKAINTGNFPELDDVEFEDVAADLIRAIDTADDILGKDAPLPPPINALGRMGR
jgi:hypothetical protein